MSSIPLQSTKILEQYIRVVLLKKLKIETIEYLNKALGELNKQGILRLYDRKCNFDVEIGIDMLLDHRDGAVENFVLMSGDSDFYDPIKQLLRHGKKVIVFSTARKVSRELNELRGNGLLIYDIQKVRDFLCFPKEIAVEALKSKKGPQSGPLSDTNNRGNCLPSPQE